MGRKNVIKNGYKILNQQDLASNITSEQTSVHNLDKASIHVTWDGTAPSGTLIVEATNDSPESPNAVWREVSFGSTITISGNTGTHDLIFNELPFNAIRLVYTAASGTGTINAALSAKVVGA